MRSRGFDLQEDEEQRAHRLSDLVDSIVVRRRWDDESQGGHADREIDQLAGLAAELSAITLRPEDGCQRRMLRRIHDLRKAGQRASMFSGMALFRTLALALHPMSAVAAIALIALVAFGGRGTSASAAEVLTRSDLAIASLVEPGTMLFRRWRIVDRIRETPESPEQRIERYTFEWIDGSDIRHAVGKSMTSGGRNYLAYLSVLDEGRYVPRVYYEPGFASQRDGLLSIVPSRHEFEAAAARFTGHERLVLETYLARGYIYEPIVSERRFNDAMLKPIGGAEPLPQVLLSIDDRAMLGDRPVYRVQSIESVRLPFRWRLSGPPDMWLERQQTVRYIAKDSFLTLRAEEHVESETGRRVDTVRELIESQTLPMPSRADEQNPFTLDDANRVPLRRQSAFEHLSQVIRTLSRAPSFIERHRDISTEERR
jgi:hypothetical protein